MCTSHLEDVGRFKMVKFRSHFNCAIAYRISIEYICSVDIWPIDNVILVVVLFNFVNSKIISYICMLYLYKRYMNVGTYFLTFY